MPDYDTLLFDNDGVLVEPPAFETQAAAIRTAFRAVGVDAPDPDHVADICGGVTPDSLRDISATYGVDPEALWDAREHHDERSQFEQFHAGARDIYDDVDVLADLTHPCGVVSNNHHSTVAFVLDHFDLGSHFETYYGRPKTVESLRRKKPNTHYLDRAMADLGGEAALYVGDSESDVLAAENAGLDSVFVRREHSRDVDLSVAPTHEIETLAGLPRLLE
ncbi:HAD family hydrolase [Natronomonas halophila]|uniref:HAD family hydrolase n=1 Tax=Natronomonas halophila TaxID=2747817 RepID=UPI0015B3C3FB|nr:HAD family hydrolase [Natronomonas halophila]QLD87211.1 HAD family hydrolase [Natronomonas halophila]